MSGLPGNPTTNSSGVYSGTVPFNWSGTVTPTLAGYTFNPENRAYANIAADQTAQNYTATGDPIAITVTSPNGGEQWLPFSSQAITWASSGYLLQVRIELSTDGGENWTVLADAIENTGTFPWNVPDMPSGNCLIRIARADPGPFAGDMSDAPFTIIPPAITVTSPNGGEQWLPFSSQAITWASSGYLLQVRIELSTDGGENWTVLADAIENTGTFPWNVPDMPSGNCLIRIGRADPGPFAGDMSDAPFTIIPPAITVTSPNGGEQWLPFSSQAITWASSGYLLQVRIELSTDGGENWTVLADAIENTGTFPWNVPDMPSGNCLIRIGRADPGPFAGDMSDAPFTIIPPAITVTSPNGGEQWLPFSSQAITWASSGYLLQVRIELSTDGGENWTVLADAIENTGTFPWNVPDMPSGNCLIRIGRADPGPFAGDMSDAPFTIIANDEETVSAPDTPAGPATGASGTSYEYSTGGSISSRGDDVQYLFDWCDGSDSGWLAVGATTAAHSWASAGTYIVRAKARCATHTATESAWSATFSVALDRDPTWVAVSRFEACADESQPTVEWHTATECGTIGFNLRRQNRVTKEYELVNPSFLPALPNSPQGGAYRLADPGAQYGEPVVYRLEEIDALGQAMSYGPFTLTFGTDCRLRETEYLPERNEREVPTDVYGYRRFTRERSAYELQRLNGRRLALQAVATLAASKNKERVRITVKGRGLFYVNSAQIASSLGISAMQAQVFIAQYRLNLTNMGKNIAWLADSNGAGVFFYNDGIETQYADRNVFWLEQGRGQAMEAISAGNAGPVADGQSFSENVHFEENHYALTGLFSSPKDDIWLWDYVEGGGAAKSFPVVVPGATSSGPAILTVNLKGATDTATDNDHHAVIFLNGTEIGGTTWNGTEGHRFEISLNSSLLHEGANTISVSGSLDTGAPYSLFYVESFDLSYQRQYQAYDNSLICRAMVMTWSRLPASPIPRSSSWMSASPRGSSN